MAWFDIPEGYTCVVRSNDTTLYAYQNSRRDTYTQNGLSWQKTATSTNFSLPSNPVCVSIPQIPSSILTGILVSATFIALGAFSMITKIVKRSFL